MGAAKMMCGQHGLWRKSPCGGQKGLFFEKAFFLRVVGGAEA